MPHAINFKALCKTNGRVNPYCLRQSNPPTTPSGPAGSLAQTGRDPRGLGPLGKGRCSRAKRFPEVDSSCSLVMVPLFRGSSRGVVPLGKGHQVVSVDWSRAELTLIRLEAREWSDWCASLTGLTSMTSGAQFDLWRASCFLWVKSPVQAASTLFRQSPFTTGVLIFVYPKSMHPQTRRLNFVSRNCNEQVDG